MNRVAALIGLGGLWLLDVSDVVDGELWNGFWHLGTRQGFHLGLYLAIGAFVFLLIRAK